MITEELKIVAAKKSDDDLGGLSDDTKEDGQSPDADELDEEGAAIDEPEGDLLVGDDEDIE